MKIEDVEVGRVVIWRPARPGGYWNPRGQRGEVVKVGKSRVQIETMDDETFEDCKKWVSPSNLEVVLKRPQL